VEWGGGMNGICSDLKLSDKIDEHSKQDFCNLFADTIFLKSNSKDEPWFQENIASFLMTLTEDKTIEKIPKEFLESFLSHLTGYTLNFREASILEFEATFHAIHMLKLALYLNNIDYAALSLQSIFNIEKDVAKHGIDLPEPEQAAFITDLDLEQQSTLYHSLKSLLGNEDLFYKRMIKWTCDLYHLSEDQALAVLLTVFPDLDDNTILTSFERNETNLEEIEALKASVDDSAEHVKFFRLLRTLLDQTQTLSDGYDKINTQKNLLGKIRTIINDTAFFDPSQVNARKKKRLEPIQKLADVFHNYPKNFDDASYNEIQTLFIELSECARRLLDPKHASDKSPTGLFGLFGAKSKLPKTYLEKTQNFLQILSQPGSDEQNNPDCLEQLNVFYDSAKTVNAGHICPPPYCK